MRKAKSLLPPEAHARQHTSLLFLGLHVNMRGRMSVSRCLFVVLWLASCVLSGSALAQAPTKTSTPAPDYSKEAFVIEENLRQVVFENDGTSTTHDTTRIRIQSDAGVQRYSVLTFPYESATGSIDIDYVRVRKPDGSIVVTPLENIQDMASEITRQAPFYSDLREKHVAVKGLSTGDVLEYESHLHVSKPLIPGQFWFSGSFLHDVINLHTELQISIPREREVKWKSPDVKPVISDEGTHRIFTWTTSQLQNKSAEEQKADQEKTLYDTARGKLPVADVQLSTFRTWQELGAWYSDLQKDRVKPSPEIRAKVAELTRNATDENARLHAIYNYVSTQFHYVGVAFGIGRYQPHFAAEVLSNQYGDCKDKHTLLASLLDAAGIRIHPALISGTRDLDPDVPSPAQFDHVIGVVPQGSGRIWLDTTTEVAPFAYILGILRDKQALVIPPDQPAALMTTPPDPQGPSVETFSIDAELDEGGTLVGNIEQRATQSDIEMIMRAAFRRLPPTQWKDLAEQVARVQGYAGEVSDVAASEPGKTDEPFHFSYKYTRKDFPDWANRRVAAAPPPMMVFAPDTKPSVPIWLGSPKQIHYESHIQLPKGYVPELRAKLDLVEPFAEYHSNYSAKGETFTVERRLLTKVREIVPGDYEAFKTFSKKISDDSDVYLNVSSPDAAAPVGFSQQTSIEGLPMSSNTAAMLAFGQALDRIRHGDMSGGLDFMHRAVQADPQFVKVWIMMAEIFRYTGQSDLRLETLRKALQANPHESVIYKSFVPALWEQHHDEEALSVLQDLQKDAPEDLDILSALAQAFLELKRYAESVATLESALKLESNRAGLYLQLGYAYMNQANDEKALPAFKKAVELDPRLYNDVAYTVADAKRYLPLSLEFAHRAVHDVEAASAKVQLPNLTLEDLSRIETMAAYWDTLGWVYFRMGDLDMAEKYLNAAWTLGQNGVVADHLAQVYEGQHKKGPAQQMHSLARAAGFGTSGWLIPPTPGSPAGWRAMSNPAGELSEMRTTKLPRITPEASSAEFFLVFGAGGKVEETKFISGSDKLSAAGKTLVAAPFKVPMPDDGPTHLVRRGLLSCSPLTGCVFVLYLPRDVRSVD